MDIEGFRKILAGDEKYRLFALTEHSNEKQYGDAYRKCAENILGLLMQLADHFNSDLKKELSSYYKYVEDYNKEHRRYLETGQYKYSKIADLEKSNDWKLHQKKYPFTLLFSIIFSTHRYEIYDYFRRSLKPYAEKGGRCLEVGTGCGLDAQFLSKHFNLKTYDTSPVSSECIDTLFPEIKSSFERTTYDFQDHDIYDVAVMTELIEHLEDPLDTLKKFRNILKPDGVGFLTFAIRMPQIDHVYHFGTVEEAQEMLKKSGLRIIEEYYAISSLNYIPQEERRVYASNPKYPVNYCCLVKKGDA